MIIKLSGLPKIKRFYDYEPIAIQTAVDKSEPQQVTQKDGI
jgi:hypothetical protein